MALNKAQIIGNLGADPEIRRLNSGDSVASFRVATTDKWRDRGSGERKERTEWHSVVVYNENLVKVVEDYLRKGSKVYVEGKLQTRQWEKDGQKHYSTEIVLQNFGGTIEMLGGKDDEDGGGRRGGRGDGGRDDNSRGGRDSGRDGGRGGRDEGRSSGGRSKDIDDEIPF